MTALEKYKTKIDKLNLKNVEFIVQRYRGTGGLSAEVSEFIEQKMNAKIQVHYLNLKEIKPMNA